MSRMYNAVVFYGVKKAIKTSGTKELSKIFAGEHPLTESAAKADLDIYCRSMSGYLRFEEDDAFVFIGKRLANADVDDPLKEFDESVLDPMSLKAIAQKIAGIGYTEKSNFHLICDHSD